MAQIQDQKNAPPRAPQYGNAFRAVVLGSCLASTVAVVDCASYDDSNALHSYGPAEDGPLDGSSSAGAQSSSTPDGGQAAGATSAAGSGGGLSSAGTGNAGTSSAGADSSAGGLAATGGTASGTLGGSAGASMGGSSGGTVAGGSGGAAAGAPSGGAGGGSVTDTLLSLKKPVTADSEETDKGNLAALGNDGVATTRWCAADGAGGHYWQVDLGASYSLGKLEIVWEKAANYQFKVEGSADGNAWASILDETATTSALADQTYPLGAAPKARYVRITTTTLPNTNTWASFFEFSVYGH